MRYLLVSTLFLLNNEIISLFALLVMTCLFISDIIVERIS